MNSLDFYSILEGWDVERYLTHGVKKCNIYIKRNESLTDPLLVEYSDGSRRRVNGNFLFTVKKLAMDYVENEQKDKIKEIEYKIMDLKQEIQKIHDLFKGVIVED